MPVLSKTNCLLCNQPRKPLFCFPGKDLNRFKKWLKAIGRENLLLDHSVEYIRNNGRLCGDHFNETAFSNSLKKRLSFYAVPTDISCNETQPDDSSLCMPQTAGLSFNTQDISSEIVTNDSLHISCVSCNKSSTFSGPSRTSTTPGDLLADQSIILPKVFPTTSTPTCSEVKQKTPKTKKILKLKAENKGLKRKLFKARNSNLQNLKSLLTTTQYEFILSQNKALKLKDPRGRRWTSASKAMALNIYLQSPSAYAILRKYFAFPSKSTLKRATGHISKNVGFCPVVQTALKEKVKKMQPMEKLCTLVFDEMAIKSSLCYNPTLDIVDGFESADRKDECPQRATQALVFLIRGLTQNWKQVIAYYFCANTIPENWMKNTVLDIIDKVHDCGLKVVATVCDQSSTNKGLYRDLGVTHENPFFLRNQQKLFALFDVPHLIKCVRNNLKLRDLNFFEINNLDDKNKVVASWTDIVQFYNLDSKEKFSVAKKITSRHVFARGLSSMKVKLAAQIFSHTVAAGMSLYVKTGLLNTKAVYTAEFIGTMNDLFDSMNSKNRFGKEYACAVSPDTDHVEFWKRCVKWIEGWKFVSSTKKNIRQPTTIKGFMQTLNATIGLWDSLKNDISYMLTNRLNQDSIENTFSVVRRRGGFRDNPEAFEFRTAIRNVIVHNFLKRANSNCEEDDGCNLLEAEKINLASVLTLCDEYGEFEEHEENVINEEVPTITDIESNVLAYISGFLANKYLKKVQCDDCHKLLVGMKLLDAHTFLLYFKDFKDSPYGLKWPTNALYNCMKEMSEIFFSNINKFFNKPNIRKNLCTVMKNIDFAFFEDHIHKDVAKDYFIIFFVTMMIKHQVQCKNVENYDEQMTKIRNKKLKHVKHL